MFNIVEIWTQLEEGETDDEKEAFAMALKLEVQQLHNVSNREHERAVKEMGDEPTKGHSMVYDAGLLLP